MMVNACQNVSKNKIIWREPRETKTILQMCFTTSRERKIVKYNCVISLNNILLHLELFILPYIYLILKLVGNLFFFKSGLGRASVVRRLDNAIHWINCHAVVKMKSFITLISWLAIYPAVESAIQPVKTRGQRCSFYIWRPFSSLDNVFKISVEFYSVKPFQPLQKTFVVWFQLFSGS